MRVSGSYQLTPQLAVKHGGAIMCVDDRGFGRSYKLYSKRPGAWLNVRTPAQRSETVDPLGVQDIPQEGDVPMGPTIVRIDGPIEQRAGYHDPCSGWSDGHDAIADRLITAFEDGDVVLIIDSPGGAAAGLQEAVNRVVKAKAAYGRKVIAYADEMIASAAYWWAASVADEIYGPESMVVGSIGARSGHVSVAGKLAKEGIVVTYFVAPGPGKVAFAPEFALTDTAKERGERDTWASFNMFASAVTAGRGISLEEIQALDADCLSGQAALTARLVDGIASFEDVLQYTYSLQSDTNEKENDNMADPEKKDPEAKAGGDEKDGEDSPAEAEGTEPSSTCKACGCANEDNSKYCDQCGASMEATPIEEEASSDDPKDDDKPAVPAKKSAVTSASTTLASIFGLRDNASDLAIKTAALTWQSTLHKCMTVTGTQTVDALLGAVIAQSDDSKRASAIEEENRALKLQGAFREKMDLLTKLSAANLPGFTRGELFVDMVDEKTGARTVHPAKMYAEMNLGTLREVAKQKLAKVPASRVASPFEPSRAAAKDAIDKGATEVAVETLKETPFVQDLANRSSASTEQLARTYNALSAQWNGETQ